MRQKNQLQHKIDAFLDRKSHQYPEIDEYARDVSRL
jgi:hypothetical protein